MKISENDAREVIRLIRQATERYRRVVGEPICERSKMILLALDIAELMAADQTGEEYVEPRLCGTIKHLIRGLGLWKEEIIDRNDRHAVAGELMRSR